MMILCGARLWMGIVVAFGFFAPGAGAGTIQDGASDASHQTLAQLFPSVGYLQFTKGVTPQVSSGTLIGDDWVLTAAYVASGASNMTFLVGGNQYDIVEMVIHPEWTGVSTDVNGIALLRTDQPVTGISPAPLYLETDELGQTATYVGYGKGGTGSTGNTTAPGIFRGGQNVVDSLGLNYAGGALVFSDDLFFSDFDSGAAHDNFLGSAIPLPYEYAIASGDGGGGVFIEVEGQQRLAGVIFFILGLDGSANSDYGDLSASIRVSSHLAWIQPFVAPPQPPPVPALGPWGIGALLTALVLATARADRK